VKDPIRLNRNPQGTQGFVRRSVSDLALQIKAGPMAGTGKSCRPWLHRAAQVRAYQAKGGKSTLPADQERRDVRDDGARSGRILRGAAEVEIGRSGTAGVVIQEADQSNQAERTTQDQASVPG
jgi:hypothetical protein